MEGKSKSSLLFTACFPRKYRAYIRYYLEEALKEDIDSAGYEVALQQAAWWNKEYRESFPEEWETAKATDITEGSAEFVTIRANALLAKSCQAEETEILKAYSKHYFKNQGKHPKVLPGPDAESSLIGSLASALLEKSSSPKWQERVIDGVSPIQLLLKGISPLQSTEIPEIEAGCQFFENTAKHRELSVKNINDQLESENYIALSITYTKETRKGSIIIRENVSSGLKGYDQILLGTQRTVDTGSSHITFKDVHLLRPDRAVNECGNNQRVVLIPKKVISLKQGSSVSEIDFSGGQDTLSNAKKGEKAKLKFSLKGKVIITKKIEQEGADIWCVR